MDESPGAVRPRRYEANVIVDNSKLKGAPVVFEENATYLNLFGRIEKESQFGTFTTDFVSRMTAQREGDHAAVHGEAKDAPHAAE